MQTYSMQTLAIAELRALKDTVAATAVVGELVVVLRRNATVGFGCFRAVMISDVAMLDVL